MDFSHDYIEAAVSSDGEQLPVWQDEEDVGLRKKFKLGQLGIRWNTKKKECTVEDGRQKRALTVPESIEKKIFECQAKVKKILLHGSLVVIADSLGNVYIIRDIRSKSRDVFKAELEYFNLADAAVVEGRLLCVAKNTFVMKEIDIDGALDMARCRVVREPGPPCTCNSGCSCNIFCAYGKSGSCSAEKQHMLRNGPRSTAVADIRKDTGEKGYRKIHVCDKIYVLGDMLTAIHKNSYEVMYQIQNSIVDLTTVNGCLYCLAQNGDVLVYRDRILVKKTGFTDKFSYTKIGGTGEIYILAGKSIRILNADLDPIGERQCGFDVAGIAENDNYVAVVGDSKRCIKLLLKPQYKGVPNFPKSGMMFPKISCLAFHEDVLYYCHEKHVSSLSIRKS